MRTVEQLQARREILIGALERVRKGWTVGTLARADNFAAVLPNSRDAVRWCAVGAIIGAGGLRGWSRTISWKQYTTISRWNDSVIGKDGSGVIAAFEAAIQQTDDEIAARSAP